MARRCCWPPESKTSLVADDSLVALRLRHDEVVRVSRPRGGLDFFLRRVEPAELDVFEDGVVKEKGVLGDEPDLFAERALGERRANRGRRSGRLPAVGS